MPFNPEAIKELRIRMSLSQTDLTDILNDYAELNKLRNREINKSLISKWENNHQGPGVDNLDLLYMIAMDCNCKDLEFYIKPVKYNGVKM